MESILTSIKKMLGITEEYEHFDTDIIIHINSVFFTLTQIGVGPENGFSISDKHAKWSSFVSETDNLEALKSYMYLKVKLLFDPPTNNAVIEKIEEQTKEFEFRLLIAAESKQQES